MLHILTQEIYVFEILEDLGFVDKESYKKEGNFFRTLIFDNNLSLLKKHLWEQGLELDGVKSLVRNWEFLTKFCECGDVYDTVGVDTNSLVTTEYGLAAFSPSFCLWGKREIPKRKKQDKTTYRGFENIYSRTGVVSTYFTEELKKEKTYILAQIGAYWQLVKTKKIPTKKYGSLDITNDWIVYTDYFAPQRKIGFYTYDLSTLEPLNDKNPSLKKINYISAGRETINGDNFFIATGKRKKWKNKETHYVMQLLKDKSCKITCEIKPYNDLAFVDAHPEYWIACFGVSDMFLFSSQEGWRNIGGNMGDGMVFVDIETNTPILSKENAWEALILLSMSSLFCSGSFLKIFPSPKAQKEWLKVKEHPEEFAVIVVKENSAFWKFMDFKGGDPYWLKHFENKNIAYKKLMSFKKGNVDASLDNDGFLSFKEGNFVVYSVERLKNSMFSLITYFSLTDLNTPIFSEKAFIIWERPSDYLHNEFSYLQSKNGDIYSATYTHSLYNFSQYLENLINKFEEIPTKDEIIRFLWGDKKEEERKLYEEMFALLEEFWWLQRLDKITNNLYAFHVYRNLTTNELIKRNGKYPIFFNQFNPIENKWIIIGLIDIEAFTKEEQKQFKNPFIFGKDKKTVMIAYDLNTQKWFVLSQKKSELPAIF